MGKVDYFTILLQKEPPIYTSGETVFGTVRIKVNERFKINSIKCLLEGWGKVHWYVIYNR